MMDMALAFIAGGLWFIGGALWRIAGCLMDWRRNS